MAGADEHFMLEVKARSGPARSVRWTNGELRCDTPNIICSSDASLCPKLAELSVDPNADDGVVKLKGLPVFSVPSSFYPPLSYLRHDPSFQDVKGENSLVLSGEVRTGRDIPEHKFEVAVLGNAFEMRRDARSFTRSLVELRRLVGNKRLIYAPGMMDVSNLALLAYMGVDLFDDSLIGALASRGKISCPEGPLDADEASWMISSSQGSDVLGASLGNAWNELNLVRHAIKKERLRELVEIRVHASPWMVSALRIFDEEHYDFQEERYPVVGPRFYANAKQSLFRPDVLRYRRRILERYQRPEHKRILLLIPCSAKKPYYTSKSHQTFRRVIQSVSNYDLVHEMIVTSPLGIVPRELELFYPAAQYDIPVTGHWDREEVAMVQEMVLHLVAQKYDHVICHLGDEGEFVKPVVDCIDTAGSNPGSKDSLNRLQEKLSELCSSYPRVPFGEDRQRTMAAVARFQFGPEAGVLVDGCKVSGSFPYSRMVQGDKQMGMLTPERGMISLTLEGAERILGKGLGWVRVGDFKMEGNLFAVGVSDADPNIRIGDEVALVRGDKVVGVGVAMMFGREMKDSARGEAVRVRHALKN